MSFESLEDPSIQIMFGAIYDFNGYKSNSVTINCAGTKWDL